jgi:hypothetical protein
MQDVRDDVKDAALRLLDLPVLGPQASTVEVVSTVLGPYEPDEAMRVSLGRVLAERARERWGDETPVGLADAQVDYSDEAACEDLQGRQVSSFQVDERCYRLVLLVVRET